MAELLPLLGLISGLLLGLTGAGGSVLAVPLLMAGMGWSLTQAAPLALMAVATAAAWGTLSAWDVTYVRYRAALLMALAGAVAAPLGMQAAHYLPPALLLRAFALSLIVIAVRMALQARQHPEETRIVRANVAGDGAPEGGPLCGVNAKGRIVWTPRCLALFGATGFTTGALSGLLGVGGGFVIVPALRAFTPLSIHSAISTSLMTIALTSGAAALSAMAGGHVPAWGQALPYVGGALAGMLLGRILARRIAGPALQISFASAMLLTAVTLLLKST